MCILPTFIGIGPGRAATTTLYESLKEHPGICMAKNTKEINFFNREYHRGPEWYRSFFEDCPEGIVTGEISNMYIYDPQVPSRIAELLPDVKLITVLRNPFDRIRSVYLYRRRAGSIEPELTLSEAIDAYPDLMTDNYYGDQLNRYLDYFARDNLLVALFEDIERDPQLFIAKIYNFIGVDPSYKAQAIHKRINPAVDARHPLFAKMIKCISGILRSAHLYSLLEISKSSDIIRGALFKTSETRPEQLEFSKQIESMLTEHLLPQIRQVELITGRSLAHWKPVSVKSE